jgi:shikimate kinase
MNETVINSVDICTSLAPEVILIGPTGAGKSTVGLLLADRLNLPSVSMDGVAEPYYNENHFH